MVKAHSPINWENEPSFNTPINEENLNKMDKTIGVLDDRIIAQDTSKLDKSTAYTMVKDISFNENNGVFTITRLNGSTFTIDTRLEKIAINFKYDYSTQKLIVTLIDGTTQSIDMSALLTQYEFTDSATLDFSTDSSGKVTATIKSGSITEDMLQPNYLAEIKVETAKSAQSMTNAKISENNAKQSELNAKASEEQAFEYSNNAQPLAQSVSGMNPTATNSTDGSVIYLKNDGYTSQDGEPTPTTPIHIGANGDKGYFDGDLVQGYRSTTTSTPNGNANYITNKNVIECKEGDTLEIMYEVGARLVFQFFNDGTWVEQIGVSSGETVTEYSCTVPSGANQAYFFIQYANITPSTAKHICVTINGMYVVRVKTTNSNIMPIANLGSAWELTDNGIKNLARNDAKEICNFALKGGKTYKINFMLLSKPNGDTSFTAYIDNVNCNYILGFVQFHRFNNNQVYTKTYTPDTDCVLRYVSFGNANSETFEFQLWCNEDEVRDYEHHTEIVANIPVSAPLYTGDYIEVYADGSGREYRKMGSIVYDGSDDEVWHLGISAPGLLYVLKPDNAKSSPNKLLCSHFVKSNGEVDYTKNRTTNINWANHWFVDSSFSTVDDWKTWLQSNPITSVYELAEPTVTPLTPEQVAEFKKLQTFKGVTHINADGEVTVRYYCNNDSGDTVGMLHEMVEEVGKVKIENIQLNFTLNGVGGINEMTLAYHLEGYADKPNVLIGVEMDSGSVADAEYIHVYSQKVTKDELRISAKSTHPTNTHTTNFIVHVTIVGIKE